jgi:putative transposase
LADTAAHARVEGPDTPRGYLRHGTRGFCRRSFHRLRLPAAFLPVFKQALLRRGIPKRLYVDNGALYRSTQLTLVCAKLGITLIHARPYMPQGKGKQACAASRLLWR